MAQISSFFARMSHRASTGDSQREHHAAVGKATGETARAGALEEHAATTFGSVCVQNTFICLQPCSMHDARLSPFSPSLRP
jgi:hypothetical protein